MLDPIIIKEKFSEGILETGIAQGQVVLKAKPEILHDLLRFCKEDARLEFNFLMDVIAVDYLGQIPRFEVVYLLFSLRHKYRLRIRVRVNDGQALPTATDLYLSADWAEREAWDMMGIVFIGHPKLKRILTFEGFEGHALRKDYPVNRRQKIPVIEKIP